jgi:hypothetical protein
MSQDPCIDNAGQIQPPKSDVFINEVPGCINRYDYQLGKYGDDYIISARDYIGMNGKTLLSSLIPFISTGQGIGIGLLNLFRYPYAKTIYITTRDPQTGYFYEVIALPITEKNIVTDIQYQLRVSKQPYPEKDRFTEISVALNKLETKDLIELMADSLIHANIVLPYIGAKSNINGYPVDGGKILLTNLGFKAYVHTSDDYIPSILMIDGIFKGKLLSYYHPTVDWVRASVSHNLYISISTSIYNDKYILDLVLKMVALMFLSYQIDIPEVNKYFNHNYPGDVSRYLPSIGAKGDIFDHLPLDDLDDLDPMDPLSIDFSPLTKLRGSSYNLLANIYNYLPKKEGFYSVDAVADTIKSMDMKLPSYYIKLLLSWFHGKYKSSRVSSKPGYILIGPERNTNAFFHRLISSTWSKLKEVFTGYPIDKAPDVYFYKGGDLKMGCFYNRSNHSINISDRYVSKIPGPLEYYLNTKRKYADAAKDFFNADYEIQRSIASNSELAHYFVHAIIRSEHRRVDAPIRFKLGANEYSESFNDAVVIIWDYVLTIDF